MIRSQENYHFVNVKFDIISGFEYEISIAGIKSQIENSSRPGGTFCRNRIPKIRTGVWLCAKIFEKAKKISRRQ